MPRLPSFRNWSPKASSTFWSHQERIAGLVGDIWILIAARLTSFEGFNIIMNFLVMPMFFLSGAMYPVTSMPPALRQLTHVNPLTYGIDAFNHVLLHEATPPMGPEFPLVLDLGIVIAVSALLLTLAALSFRKKE